MDIALIIIGGLLGVAFTGAGVSKLTGAKQLVEALDHVNAGNLRHLVGALEVAAVVGLVVGIWVPALGIAAAIGLAALMAGATVFHVRAGDAVKDYAPVLVLGTLAAVFAALRIASL